MNPYAPPDAASLAGIAPAASSDTAVRVTVSVTRWMRVVALFCFIACGLIVLGRLGVALDKRSLATFATGIAMAIVPILAGVWLRQAANRFRRGVHDSDVVMLGRGFVGFRRYIFLLGVLGIVQLATSVHELVST